MMLGLVTLKVLREAMRTLRDHPYRYARERRSRTVRAGGGSGCAVLGSFTSMEVLPRGWCARRCLDCSYADHRIRGRLQ